MSPALLLGLACALVHVGAYDENTRPLDTAAETGYSHLFNVEQLGFLAPRPGSGMRNAWNGLERFAQAEPLRCWGEDDDKSFDIAVLGASPLSGEGNTSVTAFFY
jgi:hypothetical protein